MPCPAARACRPPRGILFRDAVDEGIVIPTAGTVPLFAGTATQPWSTKMGLSPLPEFDAATAPLPRNFGTAMTTARDSAPNRAAAKILRYARDACR